MLGAAAAAALTLTTLTPGTATAASWFYDPNFCTNVQTATQRVVYGRTVEVRYGQCSGAVYGWARILGYVSGSLDGILLQVDTNKDWLPDAQDAWNASIRNYTRGYYWPSVPGYRFRACYLQNSTIMGCTNWAG